MTSDLHSMNNPIRQHVGTAVPHDDNVHPDDMARAVECVNALADVPRPAEFVASARELAELVEHIMYEEIASIVNRQRAEPDYAPPPELHRRHLLANRLVARIQRKEGEE